MARFSQQTSVIYLWDFESFFVEDHELQPLVREIRRNVTNQIGRHNEKIFLVCCDVRQVSSRTTKALNKIRSLDVIHADVNGSLEKIKQKLHQFDIDFRDQPGVIVLISGNHEFSYFLSNVERSGWRAILFYPENASKELLDCVETSIRLKNVLESVRKHQPHFTPTASSQTENPEEKSHILLTNLRSEMPTDRLLLTLSNATEEQKGQVVYLNRMTGEAVITYSCVDQEIRGDSALLMAKNCKSYLKQRDLNILAIKDPSGELGRMKFTVQQLSPTAPIFHPIDASDVMSASSGVGSMSSPEIIMAHQRSYDLTPQTEEYQNEEIADESFYYEMNGSEVVTEPMTYSLPSYANAVKQSNSKSNEIQDSCNEDQQQPQSMSSNSFRPYFHKSSMQCYHWDNPAHMAQGVYDCKFWHPRERCRFYPICMIGADACGYAHPFCGPACECDSQKRDPQKNHRLNPPSYSMFSHYVTVTDEYPIWSN